MLLGARTAFTLQAAPQTRQFAFGTLMSMVSQTFSLNEDFNFAAPLKILEAKANGLTFDPFGKFIASQSSEDKKLTIWRIQNFRNITKESERDIYYKQQSQSMSLFRRLSWSSDGAFIATTGGKFGNENIAPLIDRSNWNLLAALSGHFKPISVSRVNPTLFK